MAIPTPPSLFSPFLTLENTLQQASPFNKATDRMEELVTGTCPDSPSFSSGGACQTPRFPPLLHKTSPNIP